MFLTKGMLSSCTLKIKKKYAKFVLNVILTGNCLVCLNSLKVTNGKKQVNNMVLTIHIHHLVPRLTREMDLFTAFLVKK